MQIRWGRWWGAVAATVLAWQVARAEPVDPARFRADATTKWDAYIARFDFHGFQADVRRDYRHGANRVWEHRVVDFRYRPGNAFSQVEFSASQHPTPVVNCTVSNPHYTFQVRRNEQTKAWAVVHTAPADQAAELLKNRAPSFRYDDAALRGYRLSGQHLFALTTSVALADLLADPDVSYTVDRDPGGYAIAFRTDPAKPRTREQPFARGRVRVEPEYFLVTGYEATTDVPKLGRLSITGTNDYTVVGRVPRVTTVAATFAGHDTLKDLTVTGGTAISTLSYPLDAPPERDFTLDAFDLSKTAQAIERELDPPPEPIPLHLIFAAVGIVLLGAAFIVFRRRAAAA